MNKSKLITRSSLILFLMLILFGFIPAIQAKAPYTNIPRWQNIGWPVFWDDDDEPGINSNEVSFFRVGLLQSQYEKEHDLWPAPPYNIRLYINNEEIQLTRLTIYSKVDGVPIFQFYKIFEPNYFIPSIGYTYTIKFEFWVLKPYQEDGITEWRIFYNYTTGQEAIFEYSLEFEP